MCVNPPEPLRNEALSEYVNDVESIAIDPYSSRSVTEGQLVEVQRQTFFTW